jgi:hypothetical protein
MHNSGSPVLVLVVRGLVRTRDVEGPFPSSCCLPLFLHKINPTAVAPIANSAQGDA